MPKSGSQNSSESQGPVVSSWSCFNCRRRKSRCNRQSPCGFCSKAGVECLYPFTGRMPTRQHNSTTASLLSRLRQLENVVDSLKAQAQDKDFIPGHTNSGNTSPSKNGEGSIAEEEGAFIDARTINSRHNLSYGLSKSFGRLQVCESGTMYTGNGFWAALHGELKSVRQAFEASDIFDLSAFQDTSSTYEAEGRHMPFDFDHSNTTESTPHPAPNLLHFIWQVYVKNVDPFIKVLHVPTMSEVIRLSEGGFEKLSPGTRALVFSISLAAVTSLSDADVQNTFGDAKENVVSRFVLGTEKALSQAGILKTTDLCVAQASLIYLEIAGQNYGMRTVWMMSGILVRAAISVGLHRDGATFPNVSYFEAEMRRRLWWHICCFDARISQCYAPETMISNNMLDTREPTNCNDDDLEVNMTKEPTAREGFTDVSFTLMACELRRLCNHILSSRSSLMSSEKKKQAVQHDVLSEIENVRNWTAKKFFGNLETRRELQSSTKSLFNMLLDQLSIIVRDTNIFEKSPPTEERHMTDRSYVRALNHIENMRKWRDEPSMRQWGWVLVNFQQWYALGVVLIHLQTQTWDSACERAWTTVVKTLNEIPPAMMTENPLRESIIGMVTAARQHREEELGRQCCQSESHQIISWMPNIGASISVPEDFCFDSAPDLLAGIFTGEGEIAEQLNIAPIDLVQDPFEGSVYAGRVYSRTNYPSWYLEPTSDFETFEPSFGNLQDLLFCNSLDKGNLGSDK
ncbi:hypothetical protein TRIATDRAFT_33282 [Trichoderma atroviride IMI 206040]|uniref:Zn(2)-C6 fungal-type domain-containing protein n=1 Tax=Hypocrea atroviridis (strain ATCC 20476 / IMI 206040) TaxID=452589 RepID=G9P0I4_HYPAI|nr:uncharacterized protein TRIATDRAFT_33282 [Trichoderma atroviride IMI 206040]EHK42355.1 hypothetical protein TRIATDRAFT_33282 [Trichoderma atroviride IMI 206040]